MGNICPVGWFIRERFEVVYIKINTHTSGSSRIAGTRSREMGVK
jgi:hypothetical protein